MDGVGGTEGSKGDPLPARVIAAPVKWQSRGAEALHLPELLLTGFKSLFKEVSILSEIGRASCRERV